MIRPKKRYLLLDLKAGKPFNATEAKHLLYSAVFSFLGESGAAKAAFKLKSFDEGKQEAVAVCSLASLEDVIAALALKRKQDGFDVAVRLKKISGTIKALGVKNLRPPLAKSTFKNGKTMFGRLKGINLKGIEPKDNEFR